MVEILTKKLQFAILYMVNSDMVSLCRDGYQFVSSLTIQYRV